MLNTMVEWPMDEKTIPFFADQFGFLSNFWPSNIYIHGFHFPTAEHAYQAMKTVDVGDRATIRGLDTPGKAKRYGQTVEIIPNWNNIRRAVMCEVLYAKFLQNPELAEQLVNTKDKVLVEGNWWGDIVWGAVDYERTTTGTLHGANWLGVLLMEVRNNFSE